jgi:hypothetical protein
VENLTPVFIFLIVLFGIQVNVIAWFFIRKMHRSLKLDKELQQLNSVESVTDIGSIDAWH